MIIKLRLHNGDEICYSADADKDSFYLLDNYVYFQHINPRSIGISVVSFVYANPDVAARAFLDDMVQSWNKRIRDTSEAHSLIVLTEGDLYGHNDFIEFIREHEYREDEEICVES